MSVRNGSSLKLRRHLKFAAVALAYTSLFMLFQNFNTVPLDKLKPDFNRAYARSFASAESGADIREYAPYRPSDVDRTREVIAAPRSGSDLGSISQDWAMRQTHLITGGAEERFLLDINRRMNRMMSFDSEQDETPADLSGLDPAGRERLAQKARSRSRDDFWLKPRSMRFTSLNRVELGLGTNTSFSCSFLGDSLRWDLSRPINERFDVSLTHESARSKSSLLLNYSW